MSDDLTSIGWMPIELAPSQRGTAKTGYWVLGGWIPGPYRRWYVEWPAYRVFRRGRYEWQFGHETAEPTHWLMLPMPEFYKGP